MVASNMMAEKICPILSSRQIYPSIAIIHGTIGKHSNCVINDEPVTLAPSTLRPTGRATLVKYEIYMRMNTSNISTHEVMQ